MNYRFGPTRLASYQSSFARRATPRSDIPGLSAPQMTYASRAGGGGALAYPSPATANPNTPGEEDAPAYTPLHPSLAAPLPLNSSANRAENFQNSLNNQRATEAASAANFAAASSLPTLKVPTLAPAMAGTPATTDVYSGAFGTGPAAQKQAEAAKANFIAGQTAKMHANEALAAPMSLEEMAIRQGLKQKQDQSDAKVRATDAYTTEHAAGAKAKDAWTLQYPQSQEDLRKNADAKTTAATTLQGTQGNLNDAKAAAARDAFNPLGAKAAAAAAKDEAAKAKTARDDATAKARNDALAARAVRDRAAAAKDAAISGTGQPANPTGPYAKPGELGIPAAPSAPPQSVIPAKPYDYSGNVSISDDLAENKGLTVGDLAPPRGSSGPPNSPGFDAHGLPIALASPSRPDNQTATSSDSSNPLTQIPGLRAPSMSMIPGMGTALNAVASLRPARVAVTPQLNTTSQTPQSGAVASVRSQADHAALPVGAAYVGPDGVRRIKR